MFKNKFLKAFFLILVFGFNANIYAQNIDSCSIGIPHERFWLIKRVYLDSISRYKLDCRKGRFHKCHTSIQAEIDSIVKGLVESVLEIRKNGYASIRFFESIEHDLDTVKLLSLIRQDLSELRKIRGKLNADKKLSEHESIFLFKTLFKKYSNVFQNVNWLNGTDFELSFITDYFDTCGLLQKTQSGFVDSIATEKIHRDWNFKKTFVKSTIYSYISSMKDELKFDVMTYYFPSFEAFYQANHPCVGMNQKRLDFISASLMNDYVLICSPIFY